MSVFTAILIGLATGAVFGDTARAAPQFTDGGCARVHPTVWLRMTASPGRCVSSVNPAFALLTLPPHLWRR